MARYASSTDVARLAGVSQSSVSRSYRPHASISKRTREKSPAEDVLVAGFDLADARITLPARLVERASTFRFPRRTLA
jgi:hypothetical protein